ncbi:MAG TPA: galactose oxidase-like domain-containing protein, partial [Acidimicrobiia bacterium]|nr:galactose oxidase-like domain-containing protein [Acidimicrobiia bacterium]
VMQHAVLIPGTSSVLFFEDGAGAKILDTNTGAITPEPAGNNLFCAGQTVLSDGRVMVLGGDAAGNPQYGSVATNIYNPADGSFTPAASMHAIRWYPTGTRMPDGRVLATDGTNSGVVQQTPEIYDPANNTWTLLPASANLNIAYYPFMFVLPDGRLLEAGAFDLNGYPIKVLDPNTWTWSTVDSRVIPAGSATMYRPGKILRTGTPGGPGTTAQPGSALAYTIDMTSPSPSLVQTGSMHNPRVFLNLQTLPDGNVLVTGGDRTHDLTSAAGAVYAAEEWSPATGQWTTLASNQVPRFYHSVQVLLPDGRVLVGGGWGGAGGDTDRQRTYEIYSPPYLFKGARPTITSAPGSAGYGSGFTVTTPNASQISSVVLTSPSATTHNFDENNRYVPLAFSVSGGALHVTAPPNANYAPPGPYLLWIVDGNGVPSVADWITIS